MNRKDFPLLKQDIIYFDNAATTLKPQCMIDKIVDYYSNYSANAHRGDYDLSFKVDMEYENTRELARLYINAKHKEEIIFTSGATAGMNMIAEGFFERLIDSGDEILITQSEHASNVLPWFELANLRGAKVKYIPLDENHYVTLDNVKKSITSRTKIISLAHVTNVIGDVRPIKEIAKLAHENNIFVVVDGAQSTPHFKIDVCDLDVDFFVFSAHKLCGPTGVGVLYGKLELLEELVPVTLGGGMNESFDNVDEVYYAPLPGRLEAGTPNIAGVIGFGATLKYIMNIGMDKIHERERVLRAYLIDKIIEIPHLDIINLESDSAIVAFNINGMSSQEVAFYLNKYNICVRAGSHCAKILKDEVGVEDTVRVSLYFYNTKEEIDSLIELLKDKKKIEKEIFV